MAAARASSKKDEGNRKQLRTIEGRTFSHDLLKTRRGRADRLPRTFESVGDTRHAVAPEVDPHREREVRVRGRASPTRSMPSSMKKSFDRLVVVAAGSDARRSALGPDLRSARKGRPRMLSWISPKFPTAEIASHLNNFII